ncbi:prostatic acid phosphatase-like [Anneissia japonica]|uniref:prostatic acid phosphatase-like n=1 Tax=Anneissia japonica TaxID=1529436 RepID=UPI001425998F|nr:prostatic acid phosphatase-like [Anneissia japonica]
MLITAFLAFYIFAAVDGDSLQLVNVVYRHGDRSPTNAYPNDHYKEDHWPQGFGQLLQSGMVRQHELGQFLRIKYIDFLNATYIRTQITVRSTDVDRTLMSAACNLAGLYPPAGHQIWNSTIPWQPIPVHDVPVAEDYLLRTDGVKCPLYDKLYAEVLNSPEVKKENEDNKEFLEYVSEMAGYNTTLKISDLWHLHDPVFVEKSNNLSLPDWITDEVFKNLTLLSDIGMVNLFKGKKISKLKGGNLVQQMIKNMNEKINPTDSAFKNMAFYMYSAHDTTLAAFLTALQIYNGIQPPYATCVGVELWKNDNMQPYVKIWYRNDSTTDPYSLTLPGCNVTCLLDDFKQLTKDILPGEIKEACKLPKSEENEYLIPIAVGGSLLVLLIIALLLFKGLRNPKYQRHRDEEERPEI